MYDQGYQGPYREPEEQEAYQGSYGQTVTAQSLDVYRTLSFGPGEFLGGAMHSIDVGGEVISLPLPAEAESGQQFKYEGCGMADPATGLRGDLYVTLEFYQAVEKRSSGKKLWWLWIVAVLAVLALLASFLLISLPDKKPVRPGRDRDDRVSEEREEEDRENETEEAAPWEETGDVDTTEAETWEQSHVHSWVGPTCTDPQTCTVCGQVEGEPLGHSWTEATVERPRTCTVCGATDGAPLDPISLLEPGDIFEFGYYGNEPIRWKVLEKQADKLLVISQYGLDCVPYDDQDKNDYSPDPVTWEESYIRNWLNGHFYDNAFTREEKDKIGAVAWDSQTTPSARPSW